MSLYDPNSVPECQGVGVAVGVAVAVTVGVSVAVDPGIIAATLFDQSLTPPPCDTCADDVDVNFPRLNISVRVGRIRQIITPNSANTLH